MGFSGNTTNVQFHLDHYHKDLNTERYGEVKDKGLQSKQPRIDLRLNDIHTLTCRLTKSKVDDVNDALLRMLVSNVLPISLVDNEDFQRLCGPLEPRLVILTTRSLPLCFCRENVCFNVCCIY